MPLTSCSAAAGAAAWSEEFTAAADALPPHVHVQCMCTFHTYQDDAFFEMLAQLAHGRCSKAGDVSAGACAVFLVAAATLLQSARVLKNAAAQGPVSDAISASAAQLLRVAGQLPKGCQQPDESRWSDAQHSAHTIVLNLLENAALLLWRTARPLVDGVACMRDREADLVVTVLAALHTCFEAVGQDDALLRCDVSRTRLDILHGPALCGRLAVLRAPLPSSMQAAHRQQAGAAASRARRPGRCASRAGRHLRAR